MPTIDFVNSENLSLFWDYVAMLLTEVSPFIMISVAVVAVSLLLGIIVRSWNDASKEQRKNDEDEDYEIRRY